MRSFENNVDKIFNSLDKQYWTMDELLEYPFLQEEQTNIYEIDSFNIKILNNSRFVEDDGDDINKLLTKEKSDDQHMGISQGNKG
jgi:hypothetical protein